MCTYLWCILNCSMSCGTSKAVCTDEENCVTKHLQHSDDTYLYVYIYISYIYSLYNIYIKNCNDLKLCCTSFSIHRKMNITINMPTTYPEKPWFPQMSTSITSYLCPGLSWFWQIESGIVGRAKVLLSPFTGEEITRLASS